VLYTDDWIGHLKKTRRNNRKCSTRLESRGRTKTWETKVDTEKICRRGNEIGEKGKTWREVKRLGKRQNKMEKKLHISPMLRKEQ
jgi:hypothetical protein